MKILRRIIRQSFVNPISDFLPLLTFNLVDNFWGLQPALYISIPISIYLSAYFFVKQPLVFNWHSFASFVLLTIGFLVTLVSTTMHTEHIRQILVECMTAGTLLIISCLQGKIKNFLLRNQGTLPMENNIDEFFKVAKSLIFICSIHILLYLSFNVYNYYTPIQNKESIELSIKIIYTVVVTLFVLYETIRVHFIRQQLFQEEWWPIVNREGGVIGSVEKNASISAQQKYMHPVVRIAILSGNKLLLRKRSRKDEFFSDVWDITVSEHMRYGETIDSCVKRTLEEAIEYKDHKKAEYKFSYTAVSKSDNEVMFFFVVQLPKEQDFQLAEEYGESLKWWTIQQIDDNLGLGIFADPFMREYPYLHRKGIIGQEKEKKQSTTI